MKRRDLLKGMTVGLGAFAAYTSLPGSIREDRLAKCKPTAEPGHDRMKRNNVAPKKGSRSVDARLSLDVYSGPSQRAQTSVNQTSY